MQHKNMFQNISEWVETSSSIVPNERFATENWRNNIEDLWETCMEFDDDASAAKAADIKGLFLETVPSFYTKAQNHIIAHNLDKRRAKIESLLVRPNTEQRSDLWYKQAQELVTASQFTDILSAQTSRVRGKLVLSKVEVLDQQTTKRLATWSHEMNPFDWGIRFEPVARMIYERITQTKVKEIGRLVHPDAELKLAASPDGIIVEDFSVSGERLGGLVEFKAPISRSIGVGSADDIPKGYLHQMQIQMEVTDSEFCDYFEIQIRSANKKENIVEGPACMNGIILTIGRHQPPYDDPQPSRYIYSEIGCCALDAVIQLEEGETILEIVPWDLLGYNLVKVSRSKVWFESVKPALKTFWEDVEKAKRNEFYLTPSKRPAKVETCLIQEDLELPPQPQL
uniref:YqaJ viral recombinase domain-containing protein n=1 Tax=viral metagenome TaxID=1070528 RepID=A0A6C0IBF0_9ZZZZ